MCRPIGGCWSGGHGTESKIQIFSRDRKRSRLQINAVPESPVISRRCPISPTGMGERIAWIGALAVTVIVFPGYLGADDQTSIEPDRVVVIGRANDLVGEAEASSEGSVGAAEIAERPLLRPGELVETIPGVIATQHSGGGKANQY